ncbi:hypothetical protein A2Z33_02685 [Candidatus Gottesmanbacteria bacterium RBG_16_52_11]|uniref:Bacterial Ig domain-containing protein n=1 Tax=Candidatus Gottesmanbacteria bacterium RBG_16_52_11 TaxID=1798374 RepID=A0A1F5YML2_9BACT|nr:MAG: hypothetical protein A2Z33_02685 [Candidatus Gottesmanbacteria bacterium RBG_16_52_11]
MGGPSGRKLPVIITVLAVIILAVVAAVFAVRLGLMRNKSADVPAGAENVAFETQPEKPVGISLTVSTPANGFVSPGNIINVSGTTVPQATVVLYTKTGESVLEAGTDGSFSGSAEVGPGLDSIGIKAIASDGNESTQFRYVVYEP